MPRIVADQNVEGHLQVLLDIWTSPKWSDIWREVECEIETFDRLGLQPDCADDILWRRCQENNVVLLTGNRNAERTDSLESTIRREGTKTHLPVITIADPGELMRNADYAERVAVSLIEFLQQLQSLLGAGRLYVP